MHQKVANAQNRTGTSATAHSGHAGSPDTQNDQNFRVTYADGNFPSPNNDKNGDKK